MVRLLSSHYHFHYQATEIAAIVFRKPETDLLNLTNGLDGNLADMGR
jgi:hypothetical protein